MHWHKHLKTLLDINLHRCYSSSAVRRLHLHCHFPSNLVVKHMCHSRLQLPEGLPQKRRSSPIWFLKSADAGKKGLTTSPRTGSVGLLVIRTGLLHAACPPEQSHDASRWGGRDHHARLCNVNIVVVHSSHMRYHCHVLYFGIQEQSVSTKGLCLWLVNHLPNKPRDRTKQKEKKVCRAVTDNESH